ncbi:GPI-linked NAD(P)(+)--arginine ADP-ribosyltransferase 1 [Pelecanus crispus]|uniref:GPI-linked NAD(P)(+)--arginine ADP-ribosyltransferase 1 n=1 Tax=Pelecanus crispus TaxID=36300 RepID=UPI003F5D3C16
MAHLALGLVLLAGTLAAGSPLRRRDPNHVTEVVLDMARNSFDDRYQGCRRMMEEELEELNRTEFNNNKVYATAWTLASDTWRSQQSRVPQPPVLLPPNQAIALLAYTMQDPLYQAFNAAVREAGRSHKEYLHNFHFKVLHFLLSEALRALRDAQPHRCHDVYRGVQGIRFATQHHQSIRFGQFTSTSLEINTMERFGQDTIFSVQTCYGVPIGRFSFFPGEEEVLIPPFEVFEVTNVTRKRDSTVIQLRAQDTLSTYNCEFVKERRCKNRPCVFSAGRSIPGDPPHLWVLLLAATALAAVGSP